MKSLSRQKELITCRCYAMSQSLGSSQVFECCLCKLSLLSSQCALVNPPRHTLKNVDPFYSAKLNAFHLHPSTSHSWRHDKCGRGSPQPLSERSPIFRAVHPSNRHLCPVASSAGLPLLLRLRVLRLLRECVQVVRGQVCSAVPDKPRSQQVWRAL